MGYLICFPLIPSHHLESEPLSSSVVALSLSSLLHSIRKWHEQYVSGGKWNIFFVVKYWQSLANNMEIKDIQVLN